MYEHHRIRLERELATIRRAMFRAIEIAEQTDDYGLGDDLVQLNAEIARLMEGLLPRHTSPRAS